MGIVDWLSSIDLTDKTKTERSGKDAGATLSDQQMRLTEKHFPVDRYLVDSSKQNDIVNIIDDDIWNSEPALRPEDEIILRKLHDMLQSTADDLKLLSGELSKYHEPGVQIKTLPTPLDEDFNEKVHIEEIVNAKFHGYKIVNNPQSTSKMSQNYKVDDFAQFIANNKKNGKNASVQVSNIISNKKQPILKKLQISSIKTFNINEPDENRKDETFGKENNSKQNKCIPTVAYNEYSYKYVEPCVIASSKKPLQVQEMPSINIRSELRQQKVLQLDILPDSVETENRHTVQDNTLFIEMKHEPIQNQKLNSNTPDYKQPVYMPPKNRITSRKISTMSTYESSVSNNISTDSQQDQHTKLKRRTSPLLQKVSQENIKSHTIHKDTIRPQVHLDAWKKKLNTVYGRSLQSKPYEKKKKKVSPKSSSAKSFRKDMRLLTEQSTSNKELRRGLNNIEYIPYSKLTLGGVNVSDIERELTAIPNKSNVALNPILDKILSSNENSYRKASPIKNCENTSPKILTTSDENLLQEVLDVEQKITATLSRKTKNTNEISDKMKNDNADNLKDPDSYADDFEDDKSDASNLAIQSQSDTEHASQSLESDKIKQENTSDNNKYLEGNHERKNVSKHSNKKQNLSFKNKVDVFEFVHSVDTQDTGTQSNVFNQITPRETQTSPRIDRPIHNDLWPSIDRNGEVEKMFKLEKDFIKKLIIDEYGDLLEKNLNKPSTSCKFESENSEKNMAASQKNTQTSPARIKSVMTSPTKTKTRSTSPLALSVPTNNQNSPTSTDSNEELKLEIENDENLSISINLSSPRFNLRLPQTSQEVLSNFTPNLRVGSGQVTKNENLIKNVVNSSSTEDADYSSSDISSLGQINKKFKKLRRTKISSYSELSSSSSLSKYSSDPSGTFMPMTRKGKTNLTLKHSKKISQQSKSEGEVSLGQLR